MIKVTLPGLCWCQRMCRKYAPNPYLSRFDLDSTSTRVTPHDLRARRRYLALFSHGNQIQGENSPPPETGGGEFLPEFDFAANARKI